MTNLADSRQYYGGYPCRMGIITIMADTAVIRTAIRTVTHTDITTITIPGITATAATGIFRATDTGKKNKMLYRKRCLQAGIFSPFLQRNFFRRMDPAAMKVSIRKKSWHLVEKK
ncbi:hypothetical protein ABET14_06580 [Heyndrickxia coagulans]|uniref:hypothetical protein n=1 Tax=Heyndrickxia coagulans TaxID=1398 RepID=UPI003D196C11